MGKSLLSATKLQDLGRIISLQNLPVPSGYPKPIFRSRVKTPESLKPSRVIGGKSYEAKKMENPGDSIRIPLSKVVSDCVKRWFQETLKEAKAGDSAMQVLVGQMYFSGYGVSRDAQKGRAWMNRASRTRSSAWKVSGKHPGYNASDSDSNDAQ